MIKKYLYLIQRTNKTQVEHELINIWNTVTDTFHTDQEVINRHLQSIFKIDTGYHSTAITAMAKVGLLFTSQFYLLTLYRKLDLNAVVEAVNEKHLGPWAEIIQQNGISATPLSPYLDKELLYNHSLCIDGSKIENETGFVYEIPYVTDENLNEIIEEYKTLGVWPKQDIQ